jgi:glycerol-3-phosphate cytidylyltransferase-like family protein/phosphatidylglycerophosphate synthase
MELAYDHITESLSKFIVNKYLKPCKLWPIIHPNYISYIGFIVSLQSFVYCMLGLPGYMLNFGISNFIACILDDIDGIVAREKGIGSDHGSVIDYGIDAVTFLMYAMCLPVLFPGCVYIEYISAFGLITSISSHIIHQLDPSKPLLIGLDDYGVNTVVSINLIFSILYTIFSSQFIYTVWYYYTLFNGLTIIGAPTLALYRITQTRNLLVTKQLGSLMVNIGFLITVMYNLDNIYIKMLLCTSTIVPFVQLAVTTTPSLIGKYDDLLTDTHICLLSVTCIFIFTSNTLFQYLAAGLGVYCIHFFVLVMKRAHSLSNGVPHFDAFQCALLKDITMCIFGLYPVVIRTVYNPSIANLGILCIMYTAINYFRSQVVVYTDGTFDTMRYEHMSYLKHIRTHFYPIKIRLTVGVNSDEYVTVCKYRPVQDEVVRMNTVKITGLADEVIRAPNTMTLKLMHDMKFDAVIHGDDFTLQNFENEIRESAISTTLVSPQYDLDLVNSHHFHIIPRTKIPEEHDSH